mgnify:CR=1 FL=1
MKHLLPLLLCFSALHAQKIPSLPVWPENLTIKTPVDWLVKPATAKAEVYRSADGWDLILYNGLLLRRFLPRDRTIDGQRQRFVQIAIGDPQRHQKRTRLG